MRTIFKIHPLFYIMAFICVFTGLFKDFVIITSLIMVHECGHIMVALLFKWPIESVTIFPFGGLTIFNQRINSSLTEEFLIAVSGPLFQTLIYMFFLNKNSLFLNYHLALLIFNLLPIHPLDGSKILNVLLNKIFPFKLSLLLTYLLSIVSTVMVFFYVLNKNINLLLLLFLALLLYKLKDEFKNIKYIFNKFLFERYLYKIKYNKIKKIRGLKPESMYKSKRHYFIYKNSILKEEEVLAKMFDRE